MADIANWQQLTKVPRWSHKGVDVHGGVLQGLLATLTMPGPREVIVNDILRKGGIRDGLVDAKAWYPFAILDEIFSYLLKNQLNGIIRQFGKNTIDTAVWPPHVTSFLEALRSIDTAYHMNHRRNGKALFDHATGKIIEGNIGHSVLFPWEPSARRAVYYDSSYYPEDFDIGMAQMLARKFKPDGAAVVRVTVDDRCPMKNRGGTSTTFLVEW
jgi:hypothetical protein